MKLILSDRPLDVGAMDPDQIACIDLSALKIANCVGCFGCWTRTPGRCVIRDDATRVYPLIARSDEVIYVSRIRYGGYDTVMKRMLERAIPVQQAFIRIYRGETHHLQRDVAPKRATIVAYGAVDEAERSLFERLVARNALNMNFVDYRILFVREEEVEPTVRKLLRKWEKS
ncbi:flavodoxin family protein [uncultured Alistipes sp.]|uniref:flavodoxin family protein n=1 Tax=uncultured Alistipes sp. TaxID=538949 RepID=UPI0028063637|nr:flavodoxin family protein [uncultured Alistipes sp.]